jgi:hypothetical protein
MTVLPVINAGPALPRPRRMGEFQGDDRANYSQGRAGGVDCLFVDVF